EMSANMDRGVVARADREALALLGKKSVLRRRFNVWTLFAFAACELVTWETVLAFISQGLKNGGPAGLVYGFILAWLSTLYVSRPSSRPAKRMRGLDILLATEPYYVSCYGSTALLRLDRLELPSNF